MQTIHYPELLERARSQATNQAGLYGRIDFDKDPYRFTTDPEVRSSLPKRVADRSAFLADERIVELIRTTTMLGDVVADPYAALAGEMGVGTLVKMLKQACRDGVEAVQDAPPELHAFIADMEAKPSWLDMEMVEEGARQSRVGAAYLAPFLIRGAFLGTFLNSYAALPMAMTGALSGRRAAHRINDTASYFALTTLPGALDRYGPGFEASAMVRLMHSVVRYQALTHPDRWDVDIYGVPVPQIDQMPAGLMNIYVLAVQAERRGRSEFDDGERAVLEFSRYRCFLLGLPEELLPTDPRGILEVFHGRAALLRDDFDETCSALVRSTMDAYLQPGRSPLERVAETYEKSWGKAFVLAFCGGNPKAAAKMGVPIDALDVARVASTAPFVLGRFITMNLASQGPAFRGVLDSYTTRMVERRLATYGKPEFTTDPHAYPGRG